MKKLLGLFIFSLILLSVLWGAGTWFIAQETEKQLKALSDKNKALSAKRNQNSNSFEMSEYKNTSFFSAKVTAKLSSDIPLLDSLLSNNQIINKVQHGPIIVDASGVNIAASKWTSTLDESSLDEENRALLKQLFGDKAPIVATTLIDFAGNAHYELVIPALNQEGIGSLAIDGITLTGSHSFEDNQGSAELNIGEMYLKDPSTEIIIPNLVASINIHGFAGSQMLGNSEITAKSIKFSSTDGDDIHFDVLASTQSKQDGKTLLGDIKLTLENIQEASKKIKHIVYQMNYSGLSIQGLNQFSDIEARITNLENQLSWNTDATTTPEGQEKMLALVDKVQTANQALLRSFFNSVLITKQSQLQQKLIISSDQSQSKLSNELIYTGLADQKSIDVDKLPNGDTRELLMAMAGTLSIQISKEMLPPALLAPLNASVQFGVSKETPKSFTLDASLTDGKINLNGETLTPEEFMAKFTLGAAPEGIELGLPADIEQRILEEGLNQEILDAMEESADIDPEVLKQMQELYKQTQPQPPLLDTNPALN
jgi:hypothetical protein